METVTLFFYYEELLKAVYWRGKTSAELSVRIYSCDDDVLWRAARPAGRAGRPGRGRRQALSRRAAQHTSLSRCANFRRPKLSACYTFIMHERNHYKLKLIFSVSVFIHRLFTGT